MQTSKPISMAILQFERLHRNAALASLSSYVGSIIFASGDEPRRTSFAKRTISQVVEA